MVAESLVSMLPTPRPVQFPGDPLPLFPGWSSVRVKRVGNRQGYRLQPSLTPMWSTGSSGAPPHLTCLRCSDTELCWWLPNTVCIYSASFGRVKKLTQTLVLTKQGSSGSWSAYKSSPVHFACSMKATQREGEV